MSEDIPGAMKFDDGKPPIVRGCLRYFSRALEAVANVSAYGFSKYKGWGGWRKVDNAEERYMDALGRHTLECAGDPRAVDPETNCYHLAHVAWNALALLDLVVEADSQQRQFTPYQPAEVKINIYEDAIAPPAEKLPFCHCIGSCFAKDYDDLPHGRRCKMEP